MMPLIKMTNRWRLSAKIFVMFFVLAGTALAAAVLAADEDNVGGFAWSENIGWISFNNSAVDGTAGGGGSKDYGVSINGITGEMSGFAWSENIGWISFNPDDLAGCPTAPCVAVVGILPSGGNRYLTGWARAISARDESAAGGWNGFIKLDGSYIDANGDFYGWMISSADATTGVIGWVNLNSRNCNGSNCTAAGDYKVHTGVQFAPVAAMKCDGVCLGGYCDTNPDSTWEMFVPAGSCFSCVYEVNNVSEPADEVQCTHWELEGTDYKGTYAGRQDLTFTQDVPTGVYMLKLTVSTTSKAENNDDCSLGLSDTVQHKINIKKDVSAGFMCTIDDPAAEGGPVWFDCESDVFEKKVFKGGKIFVADDAALGLAEYSTASEDGSMINSRVWTFTVDGNIIDGGTGSVASFTAGKANLLQLDVADNAGRANCKKTNITGKNLPTWQEVSPISKILGGLYANLSKIFTAY